MNRILRFLFLTLLVVSTIGTATAGIHWPWSSKKKPAVVQTSDPIQPGPIRATHTKPARKSTTTDGDDTVSQGPTPFSGPVEMAMKQAGSSTLDLRSLPQAPPEKFERPERAQPRIAPRTLGPGLNPPPGTSTPSVAPRSAPAPPPIQSFDGMNYNTNGNGHPPDTNGDVGPNHYIQTINTSIGIYQKNGTPITTVTFNSFMHQGNFGNLCDTNNFGDPVVLYDTFEDRWVITDFAFQLSGDDVVNPPGSFQCIAVSMTGDPVSGGWNFYSINTAGGLGDYPKFGIWPDGLYMSVNMFDYAASGNYQSPRVYAFNKAQMYAGSPTVQVVTFNGPQVFTFYGPVDDFTLLPSNARLQTGTPPEGAPNYFVSTWVFLDALTVYKFRVDWNRISLSTFTGPDFPATATGWPNADVPNAQSLGGHNNGVEPPTQSSEGLDVLEIRAMVQNQYSNFGGVESLWLAHTVRRPGVDGSNNPNGLAAPRWYQVDVTGGTVNASLPQAATWDPDNANVMSRFMPSVAVDRAGNMAMGYSTSNITTKPALKYAGRLAGDPVNTLSQTEQLLFQGTGTQFGDCGGVCTRWGDYSAMTLDPDGCTFWYTNEYYAVDGLNHQTRIGSFTFPSCTPVGAGGAVSGTVTATTGGAPLSGATIRLGARTATTNGSGVYSFTSIPAGTYPTLTASFPGYVDAAASSIIVTDGGTTTQNFSLATAPASACLTDTTQSDFQTGVPTLVDLATSPGDVTLLNAASIDQQNTTGGVPANFDATNWVGQTFNVSATGQLVAVDVDLFCSLCTGTTPNVTVSIRAASGGAPTGPDLAVATIPGFNSGSDAFFNVTFTSPPTVTHGLQYAIVLRAASNPSAGTYAWNASSGSVYSGGRISASSNNGGTWTPVISDAVFRTYVKTGFAASGNLVSSVKDANPLSGLSPVWATLSWTGTAPANTSIRFQVAGSNSSYGPFTFVGPDGTAGTFFTTSPASLSQFYGFRYLQYKAYLDTTNSTATPTVSDVTICYADSDCSATVTVTPAAAQVCANSTGNTASGPAGVSSYSWSITNGSITSGATSQTVTYSAGSSGTVGLQLTIVDAAGCHRTGSVNVPINTPTNVVATATTPTSVTITWSGTAGTTYQVIRVAAGNVPTTIGSTTSGTLTDSAATPNTAYLYKVHATAPCPSPDGVDLATTVIFTDPSLVAGTTAVKAAHIVELRTAVDAVRTLAGLGAGSYTDPALNPGATIVKAAHLTDLRSALNAARSALSLPAVSYSRPSIVGGTTIILAVDINELRSGVR